MSEPVEGPQMTREQYFIVQRLKHKVTSGKHQLLEAFKAAAVLSPELLARMGMREAVGALEVELQRLKACVLARTPEGIDG